MTLPIINNMKQLFHSSEEQEDNRPERELLFFWGKHPDAKFTISTICYVLDYPKPAVEKDLNALIEKGLVELNTNNDATLYSLTTNNLKRRPVIEWATHNHIW